MIYFLLEARTNKKMISFAFLNVGFQIVLSRHFLFWVIFCSRQLDIEFMDPVINLLFDFE